MERFILPSVKIHPAIQKFVAEDHQFIIKDAIEAIEKYDILIITMAGNPFCHRAVKLLGSTGVNFHEIKIGSYLSQWRKRTALKMWSGWQSIPIIFVQGVLIGGFEDLKKIIESNELNELLSSP